MMNGYSKDTEHVLTEEIADSVKRARETMLAQRHIFENDECRVLIVAYPNGTFSLQHNYGMLMRTFARIMAEEEANS